MTANTNNLTVAICTHNRADMAFARVEELRAEYSSAGIIKILVIDNSDDCHHTNLLSQRLVAFGDVKFAHIEPPSLSYARNEALRVCDTDYLAYIDDDAIACEGWAGSILNVFKASAPAAVGGPISLKWPGQGPPEWLSPGEMGYLGQLDLGATERWLGDSEFIFGGNMAFDVGALRQVGGFSPRLGRMGAHPLLSMEEIAVQKELRRSGFLIRYCPDARVVHLVQEERLNRNWFRARAVWQTVSEALALENPLTAQQRCARLADLSKQQGAAYLLPAFFKADTPIEFSRQLDLLTNLVALLLQAKNFDDEEVERHFDEFDLSGAEPEKIREGYKNLEREKQNLVEQCNEAYKLYDMAAESRYQLMNSTSWRITAPLRLVGARLRRAIQWFGDAFYFR